MKTLNSIGLDNRKTKKIATDLNHLLANFQLYYQNLRGIHWNVKGKNFFDLHVKFEELYTDANLKVDEIAERVLTLGATPLHTYEDYIEKAQVPIGKNISEDEKAVRLIVNSLTELLKIERGILDKSADANDEGTNSMMSDFITEQEKTVWMMKAWLGETV
jgi:starvation-inducible DNA-binding protein